MRTFVGQAARGVVIGLVLLGPWLPRAQSVVRQVPVAGMWRLTGSLVTGRYLHTATLLPNGQVLIAGGGATTGLASAELYTPQTARWTATGRLHAARVAAASVLLPNGSVLIVGGYGPSSVSNNVRASAEIYDPRTARWTITGSLHDARWGCTATLLRDGTVLVAGGHNGRAELSSAELYNPRTGTWRLTGSLRVARSGHTATVLPNGRVLMTGGTPAPTTDLYDPRTGRWTEAGAAPSGGFTTATVLRTGQVLVTGGTRGGPVHAALYDPPSGRWRRTAAPSLGASGVWSTATRLPSGQVLLVAVASGQGIALAATALYDATTGRWTPTAPPPRHTALFGHTATLLQDGAVLLAGGATMTRVLAAAALYR